MVSLPFVFGPALFNDDGETDVVCACRERTERIRSSELERNDIHVHSGL